VKIIKDGSRREKEIFFLKTKINENFVDFRLEYFFNKKKKNFSVSILYIYLFITIISSLF
jgi:hypothetical protein